MAERSERIGVFEAPVRAEEGWALHEKRLSGFRRSLKPASGNARLALRFEGTAVSLLRAPMWQELQAEPGVDYFLPGQGATRPGRSVLGGTLLVRVDGGATRALDLAACPVEIPLAEGLAAGPHELELIAPEPGPLCILGFRVLKRPFGVIRGTLRGEREPYLNDVAVTLWRDGVFYERRLARNPFTKEVRLWGLAPGAYALEIEALGWEKRRIEGLRVEAGGEAVFPETRLALLPKKPRAGRLPRARPGHFRLVKFGHMDTWGQRGAEYLRLLAELTNLIAPDLLLISNEVNWPYVAGALRILRVPFLITSGNHGLPGFSDFFGPKLSCLRIGKVFIANYSEHWEHDTRDLEALFAEAGGAEYRILQGVEGNLPGALAKRLQVDLHAFGHGFTEADAQKATWRHLGKEFHVVDVDLKTKAAHVIEVTDGTDRMRKKYPLPRAEPFRPVTFSPANDGTHAEVTASVFNPMFETIRAARLCFRLPPGRYVSSRGVVEHAFGEAHGRPGEVFVTLDLPPKEKIQVRVRPA